VFILRDFRHRQNIILAQLVSATGEILGNTGNFLFEFGLETKKKSGLNQNFVNLKHKSRKVMRIIFKFSKFDHTHLF
jgi:hypothetical protein